MHLFWCHIKEIISWSTIYDNDSPSFMSTILAWIWELCLRKCSHRLQKEQALRCCQRKRLMKRVIRMGLLINKSFQFMHLLQYTNRCAFPIAAKLLALYMYYIFIRKKKQKKAISMTQALIIVAWLHLTIICIFDYKTFYLIRIIRMQSTIWTFLCLTFVWIIISN